MPGSLIETSSRLQAQADSKTETLRAANLALAAQIAPCSLSPAAKQDVATTLRPYSGKQVRLRAYAVDAEGIRLALQIEAALKSANIQSFFLTRLSREFREWASASSGHRWKRRSRKPFSAALGKYLLLARRNRKPRGPS